MIGEEEESTTVDGTIAGIATDDGPGTDRTDTEETDRPLVDGTDETRRRESIVGDLPHVAKHVSKTSAVRIGRDLDRALAIGGKGLTHRRHSAADFFSFKNIGDIRTLARPKLVRILLPIHSKRIFMHRAIYQSPEDRPPTCALRVGVDSLRFLPSLAIRLHRKARETAV